MTKIFSLSLILSSLVLSLYAMEIGDIEIAENIAKKYLPITANFGCQEEIRRMDVAIKDLVITEAGKNKGDQFSLKWVELFSKLR